MTITMKTLYQGNTLTSKDAADGLGIDPYLPSPALVKAVQLAQILGRPLLVKGEPGCGKSRLAEAVAAELYGKQFRDFYFEWHVRSTSKAQDGLYRIDHLSRLRDANLRSETIDLKITFTKDKEGHYRTQSPYFSFGVLGAAFRATVGAGAQPPVVLIDEIDKADIDFPNDLLLELDRMEFGIPEADTADGKPVIIKADPGNRPVIIITSNDEKQLPAAFLRRCLFHYIDFEDIRFEAIVTARFPGLQQKQQLVAQGIEAFRSWRRHIDEKAPGVKNISTSELLDWFSLIALDLANGGKEPEIAGNKAPPYPEVLLKEIESIQAFVSTPLSS